MHRDHSVPYGVLRDFTSRIVHLRPSPSDMRQITTLPQYVQCSAELYMRLPEIHSCTALCVRGGSRSSSFSQKPIKYRHIRCPCQWIHLPTSTEGPSSRFATYLAFRWENKGEGHWPWIATSASSGLCVTNPTSTLIP